MVTAELLHDPEPEVRTTAWRLAVGSVPDNQSEWLLNELIAELARGDADTQRSLNRALAVFGDRARIRLEAVNVHASQALDLMADPEFVADANIALARKVAVLGTDGHD